MSINRVFLVSASFRANLNGAKRLGGALELHLSNTEQQAVRPAMSSNIVLAFGGSVAKFLGI